MKCMQLTTGILLMTYFFSIDPYNGKTTIDGCIKPLNERILLTDCLSNVRQPLASVVNKYLPSTVAPTYIHKS